MTTKQKIQVTAQVDESDFQFLNQVRKRLASTGAEVSMGAVVRHVIRQAREK